MYVMREEVKQEIRDASDKRIAANLEVLRIYGPDEFDHHRGWKEERYAVTDFEGYTAVWIEALEAEQACRNALSG